MIPAGERGVSVCMREEHLRVSVNVLGKGLAVDCQHRLGQENGRYTWTTHYRYTSTVGLLVYRIPIASSSVGTHARDRSRLADLMR